DEGGLSLSRLSPYPNGVARVLGRRSADGESPHVGLTPNPTGEQLPRLVHVRIHVRQIAERDLAIATAVASDDAHVEDRGIQDSASPRRAIHKAGTIGQPGESPQPLAARHFPAIAATDLDYLEADVKSTRDVQTLNGNRAIIGRPTGRRIDVGGRQGRYPFSARAIPCDHHQFDGP